MVRERKGGKGDNGRMVTVGLCETWGEEVPSLINIPSRLTLDAYSLLGQEQWSLGCRPSRDG